VERTAKSLRRCVSFFIKIKIKIEYSSHDFENPEYIRRKNSFYRASVPLKQKTREGYIVTYNRLMDTNPSKFNYAECVKYLFMTCEVQNLVNGTSNGQVIIMDASGVSFGHLTHLNIMFLKKICFYIQEAAPVRLKAFHVLNTVPIMDTLLNLAKPFLKAELLELVSQQCVIA